MSIELIDRRVREALKLNARLADEYGEDRERFLDSRAQMDADELNLAQRGRHGIQNRMKRHEHDAQTVGALVAGACFVVLVGLVVALVWA